MSGEAIVFLCVVGAFFFFAPIVLLDRVRVATHRTQLKLDETNRLLAQLVASRSVPPPASVRPSKRPLDEDDLALLRLPHL